MPAWYNDVQMADALQAYIQAKLSGVPCWVELPDEAWHPSANRRKFGLQTCQGLIRASGFRNYVGTTLSHCGTKGRIQTSR